VFVVMKLKTRTVEIAGTTCQADEAWMTPIARNLTAAGDERVCGTLCRTGESECSDRLVLLGEGHLRAAVREFVQRYHEERPHQGRGNALIAPKTTVFGTGQVNCRKRLGGLLKFYYRQAA
jgi:hypothetical protein